MARAFAVGSTGKLQERVLTAVRHEFELNRLHHCDSRILLRIIEAFADSEQQVIFLEPAFVEWAHLKNPIVDKWFCEMEIVLYVSSIPSADHSS